MGVFCGGDGEYDEGIKKEARKALFLGSIVILYPYLLKQKVTKTFSPLPHLHSPGSVFHSLAGLALFSAQTAALALRDIRTLPASCLTRQMSCNYFSNLFE